MLKYVFQINLNKITSSQNNQNMFDNQINNYIIFLKIMQNCTLSNHQERKKAVIPIKLLNKRNSIKFVE